MALIAGKEIVVNKQPASNRGFVKDRRLCAACDGTGTQVSMRAAYGIVVCDGCNGRGYVRVWRKE